MRGLMLKDLYCLKQNIRSLLFVLVIWGVIFLPNKDGGLGLISLSLIMGVMQIFTLASYDKQAKWDTYALSMPLTREKIVREKYSMAVLMIAMSAAASTVLVTITWIIRSGGLSEYFILTTFATLALGAGLALVYAAVSLPLSLWLGVEKARYIPVVLIAILFFLGYLLANSHDLRHIQTDSLLLFILCADILSAALFVISYFISISIYRKKDF